MHKASLRAVALTLGTLGSAFGGVNSSQAAPPTQADAARLEHARTVAHWTPERRAAAIPRDFVIDPRGYGYLKLRDGALYPYGHSVAAISMRTPLETSTTGDQIPPVDTSAVVTNAEWTAQSIVREAAGRIYFELPDNAPRTRWAGYVCSGTVVTDDTSGRSIIQTAAHCVYDDFHKAFARNVLFIPNQAASGTHTDLYCGNDLYGCWTPNFGVVDVDWTTRVFPDNITWDYAYYVVRNGGSHSGAGGGANLVLDSTTGSLTVSFAMPTAPGSGDKRTYALGYSYSDDPNFMYCAQALRTIGASDWWLGRCGLSGGSSGGPWLLPVNGGNGTLFSVNSWGYTTQPGMAGPMMNTTSARCVFSNAKSRTLFATRPADGNAGYKPGCP